MCSGAFERLLIRLGIGGTKGYLTIGKTAISGETVATSRLSTKGQLVIPKEIRDYLGVAPGDRIDFVVEEDGRVSLRPALVDFRDLRGLLHDAARPGVSLEDIERAIRERHRSA